MFGVLALLSWQGLAQDLSSGVAPWQVGNRAAVILKPHPNWMPAPSGAHWIGAAEEDSRTKPPGAQIFEMPLVVTDRGFLRVRLAADNQVTLTVEGSGGSAHSPIGHSANGEGTAYVRREGQPRCGPSPAGLLIAGGFEKAWYACGMAGADGWDCGR